MINDENEFNRCMTVFMLNAINEKQFENYPHDDIDYIKNKISLQYKMNDLSFVKPMLDEMIKKGFLCVVPREPESCYQFTDSGIKFYEKERRDWQYINTVLANYSFSQENLSANAYVPPTSITMPEHRNNHAFEILFSPENQSKKEENIQETRACTEVECGSMAPPAPNTNTHSSDVQTEPDDDFLSDENLDENEREILSDYMQRLKTKLHGEGGEISYFTEESVPPEPMYYFHKTFFLSVLASFLWINLLSLVLYYFKDLFDYSLPFLWGVGGVSGTLTLFSFFIFLAKAKEKKKRNLPCKVIVLLSFILFLLVTMISMGVYLLLYTGYTLSDWEIYVPSVLATFLPFGGIMFVLLYKSGKMTVKEV